ncbi:replicative helicase loader/inhibitor [Paenibacillus melissococcoides]|uniref:Replicative helicase loader/inhibitor n=1 Tax=Paenibacillus melissococcoides TaxID=2912268 RepID=A0ABM9GAV2_9BACL|nr:MULTISPECIES: replicative helicase loader/inhibitor [Paenibacillus]MEB9896782.1 replicative helicase loader/inhibitor [Bacillus cereus]CAH8248599.1 replicative helicase loader/inhibitor [Paenibacillus melissococcoides]CAH8714288.1 replicative helicase loader/inhibitor [Paenibacillus melissococcoides]CAH8719945.1 replicative helicase loader/inhibitor [Paenibacillus melissococcoides]
MKLFFILNNVYPTFTADDEYKIEVWHRILADYPFENAERNLYLHIRNSQYPPTPADLMRPVSPVDHYRQQTQERLAAVNQWALEMTQRGMLTDGTD